VATGKERLRLALPYRSALTVAFAADGRTLATGHGDGTALLWDVTGLRAGPRPGGPTAAALPRWWADLLGPDAPTAFRALWALTRAPAEAAALANQHLRPVRPADGRQTAALIADLGSDRFVLREKATAALQQLGASAGPALRQALQDDPTLEARRRIEQLLRRIDSQAGADRLRVTRVVELLEYLGTPAARQLLRELAEGVPTAEETRAARAALERLARRTAGGQ
jgi:hypothetical protein